MTRLPRACERLLQYLGDKLFISDGRNGWSIYVAHRTDDESCIQALVDEFGGQLVIEPYGRNAGKPQWQLRDLPRTETLLRDAMPFLTSWRPAYAQMWLDEWAAS